jgi:hypothetical protein
MSQIIPFESAQLSTNVANLFQVARLGSAPTGGFPVISIKGKVFTKTQGDTRELITKPGEDGEPASSIEVVIVAQNPHRSKVFYSSGYTEGSDAKPTCYSNNGLTPEADAESPQSKKCATCQHNQWGSRVSESGSKGKACSDSQRLAVAPIGMINDPMLIRVPAASLKALDQFGDTLAKRNVPYQLVAVKIGFDYTVAHPALTFKGIGMVDDATAMQIHNVSTSDVVQQIIGLASIPREEAFAPESAPAIAAPVYQPAPAPVAQPIPVAPTPVPEPQPIPVATAPVPEPQPIPVAVAPVAKPAAPVIEVTGGLESEIADVMAGLDFDD